MSLNVGAFLAASGVATTVRRYARDETIFTPGDACDEILYIQTGGVKLSALSRIGRRVDLPMLGPGEFFGEGSLGGQRIRVGSATAITPSTIICVAKKAMFRLLRLEPAMSGRFISHMLSRNIRLEEDLIAQLLPWRRDVRGVAARLSDAARNENLTGDGEPERIVALRVSPHRPTMLGVRA